MFKHFDIRDDGVECTYDNVNDFQNHCFNLKIVDGVVQYMDNNGDIHELITSKGITAGGSWLSSKIPPPFDIFQDDNVRKANEASSMYIAIIVKVILNDSLYSDDFNAVFEGYNINNMAHPDGQSFASLVNEWSKENSVIINIIISACKFNIVKHKKDEQSFIPTLLPKREKIGLSDLVAEIKGVTYSYTKHDGPLSNVNVKKYSKIELLQKISECEAQKNKIIEDSKFSMLYHISRLNSSYLSVSLIKRIRMLAQASIIKDCESLNLDEDSVIKFITRARKRNTKTAIRSLIKDEILKFINNQVAYELPPKQ